MVDGIHMLMQSDLEGAVNIGCPQYVTVDELVATVIEVSGKEINIKHIDGPVGVQSRYFSNARIYLELREPFGFVNCQDDVL